MPPRESQPWAGCDQPVSGVGLLGDSRSINPTQHKYSLADVPRDGLTVSRCPPSATVSGRLPSCKEASHLPYPGQASNDTTDSAMN